MYAGMLRSACSETLAVGTRPRLLYVVIKLASAKEKASRKRDASEHSWRFFRPVHHW
jgi:hypothetical protein